jgi:hypothetical protein
MRTLIVLAALTVCGCGNRFNGTWKFVSAQCAGQTFTAIDSTYKSLSISFDGDKGSVSRDIVNWNDSQDCTLVEPKKFSYDGDKVTMEPSGVTTCDKTCALYPASGYADYSCRVTVNTGKSEATASFPDDKTLQLTTTYDHDVKETLGEPCSVLATSGTAVITFAKQ